MTIPPTPSPWRNLQDAARAYNSVQSNGTDKRKLELAMYAASEIHRRSMKPKEEEYIYSPALLWGLCGMLLVLVVTLGIIGGLHR